MIVCEFDKLVMNKVSATIGLGRAGNRRGFAVGRRAFTARPHDGSVAPRVQPSVVRNSTLAVIVC